MIAIRFAVVAAVIFIVCASLEWFFYHLYHIIKKPGDKANFIHFPMLQQLCIHCRFCHCNTTHEVLRNDVCVYPCASLRMLLLLIISICTDTIRIFSTHSFCYSNSCVPMQRNPRYRHPAQPFAYCSLACIRCLD